ncbi:hypothetical protein DFR40_0292, partial [Azonexus fungiphilus]
FVQKFAADGTLSGSAVQLEAISKTNGADLGPQVTAVGSSGEYVVTWYGIDSAGDNSIFVQKFAADGTLSGSAVQLEAIGSTTGVDQSPQVTAVGSSGEYVVTWYGIDSAGDNSIFVQKFAADGTLSGSAVQLEAIGNTTGVDQYPQVTAVGSSGEYVVTWHGQDSASDYSIFVQKFAADGTLSGSAVQLEAIGNTTGVDQYPQVTAVGSSGEYVVTWHGQDSASDYSIFVQKFAADGTLSGSAVQLEAIGSTTGVDQSPQVTAVGSSGEYVVAWYGVDSAGDNSIFVQKFAADGTLSGSAVQLEAIGSTTGVDQSPQVTAVGSSGEYVVTWYGIDSAGDNSIFVQKFHSDGSPYANSNRVNVTADDTLSKAYLVNQNVSVSSLDDILNSLDAQFNEVTAYVNTSTDFTQGMTGLTAGTYHLYLVDPLNNVTAAQNTFQVL